MPASQVTFLAFARCQQQPSMAPTELCPEVPPTNSVPASNPQEAVAARSEQHPQQEDAGADQLPEEPIVVQSGTANSDPPGSDECVVSAECLSAERTAVKGPTVTTRVSRCVQPAALENVADVIQQKGAALKRKRMDTRSEALSSGSDVSLVCSEALSSDADSQTSEGQSECDSERSPKPTLQAAKRPRPSAKKGLTVAQLKERYCPMHAMSMYTLG